MNNGFIRNVSTSSVTSADRTAVSSWYAQPLQSADVGQHERYIENRRTITLTVARSRAINFANIAGRRAFGISFATSVKTIVVPSLISGESVVNNNEGKNRARPRASQKYNVS